MKQMKKDTKEAAGAALARRINRSGMEASAIESRREALFNTR